MGNALAGPDSELQTGLQVEEGDRAMLELCPNDAFCFEAEPVSIKS
jgi:hypothetical protein